MLEKDFSVSDALREIENFLRDNIMYILKNKYGDNWEQYLGVSDERIKKWNERIEDERKRLNGHCVENRKLYYADFYDLETIISKNWTGVFSKCFEKKSVFEYQMSQLEGFRNPNAHNRDLADYQKHLLLGYIGEIKNGIMKYRGDIEMQSTYFPEYDSIIINGKTYKNQWAHLPGVYRCNDELEITVYVTSPSAQKVYYQLTQGMCKEDKWTEDNHFKIKINVEKLGRIQLQLFYKSDADYHLNNDYGFDGMISINYTVVPR